MFDIYRPVCGMHVRGCRRRSAPVWVTGKSC